MLADTALLDMVFVMDATGSMSSYIQSAQSTIRSVVQEIVAAEKADVRFGLVSYRDHPPQESTYVTNVFDFTKSITKMRENLDTLSAHGGGDGPEAVADGLQAVLKLGFRPEATKVCILIADAPPHGLAPSGDGFPNGCPCGFDPVAVCREMAAEGITLYCIGCEPSLTPYKAFFMAMAAITGGQYCPLGNAQALSSAVVGGVREEISLERVMGEARRNLAECSGMSEEQQAAALQDHLRSKGTRANHLRRDGAANAVLTPDAVLMSKAATLAEARSTFTPAAHEGVEGCYRVSSDCLDESCTRSARRSSAGSTRSRKAAAPASPSVIDRLMTWSGLREPPAAAAPSMPAPVMMDRCASAVAPAYAAAPAYAPASAPSSYSVVEDEISMSQCERLVQKSAARAKLSAVRK